MGNFKTSISTALVILLLGISALNATDNAALKIRILEFENAVKNNNMDSILNVVPPKIMATISEKFNINIEQLQAAMKDAMVNAMASVTMLSFKMDLENAVKKETVAGRIYLLVPTTTTMTLDETEVQSKSHTLAFVDGGTWYLVRISDDQQVQFLKAAYPEFDSVTFPKGTTQLLEN